MGNQSSQPIKPEDNIDLYNVESVARICHFTVQQVNGLLNIWKKIMAIK